MIENIIFKNLLKSEPFGMGSLFKHIDYFSKDLHSNYIDCSESVAHQLNLTSKEDINGKSDHCFGWSKERTHFLREHDLAVIKNKTVVCKLEDPWTNTDGKKIQLLSYKIPLMTNKKIIGVTGISINLVTFNLVQNTEKPDFFTSLRKIFTNRESQVLFHLVHGKSAKEIAILLGLKKRTVEFYLNNIKTKAHVSSKSELIEKVIEGFI